jgi:hypothetical protein
VCECLSCGVMRLFGVVCYLGFLNIIVPSGVVTYVKSASMSFFCFCLSLRGVGEGFVYWVFVCSKWRVVGASSSARITESRSCGWCCVNCGSVRIEHQPPKLGVVGSNPTSPAIFLKKRLLLRLFTCNCCDPSNGILWHAQTVNARVVCLL